MAYLHACSYVVSSKENDCLVRRKNGCKKIPAYFLRPSLPAYRRWRRLVNWREALLLSHHDLLLAAFEIAVMTSWNCQIKHQAKHSKANDVCMSVKNDEENDIRAFLTFFSLFHFSSLYLFFLTFSVFLLEIWSWLAGKKLPCWKMIDKGGEIFWAHRQRT